MKSSVLERTSREMNIAIVLFFFSNALIAKAYEYDYDYDYDYWDYYDYGYCEDEWYLTCEGDFCTDKTEWVDIEKEVPIPDTNLKKLDSQYLEILTVSALKECTPSLGIKVWTLTIYIIHMYVLSFNF